MSKMSDCPMKILLSSEKAKPCWGKNALISANDDEITIHLAEENTLNSLQKAARRLCAQQITKVELIGDNWNLDKCWAFWQGFYSPKNKSVIYWCKLPLHEQKELTDRIKITSWVRKTINTPSEQLSPQQLMQNSIDLLTEINPEIISYQTILGEELDEKGYAGIYTVGKGSCRQPGMLIVDVNPTRDPDASIAYALVGKGITFDSGGYSLKPSSSMDSMKSDMGGAALVVGSLALALLRGLTQRVCLILCCADNLVSGSACKLGDIIHYRNGKTVEIMNTDAEGRLVLADGLLEAEAKHPKVIIDCATLTGAAKIALGNDYHALLSFDHSLVTTFMASAKEEKERFWPLPLAEFHRHHLPSNFADLSNAASSANTAGASTAAAFLSHFVTHYQNNWLHIDCSATYRKSAVDEWAAGATGIGVCTLANFLLKTNN